MSRALRNPGMLLLPLIAFLAVFYLLPVALMLLRGAGPHFDLAPLLKQLGDPITRHVLWTTVRVAIFTTLITAVLAYPLAYFIVTAPDRIAAILMAVVLVPFWTSILIRSYAWMVLLGRTGVINEFLHWIGVIDTPIRMLNTTFAVYVGMVHVLLPFMILPVLSTLKGIDGRLVAAAENLGAGPFSVFRFVILPLSLPGVLAGCVLVFVLSLGFYITPALIGGPKDMMISVLIAQKVDLYDWDGASAVAAILLVLTLIALVVVSRVISLERVLGGSRA